jgi:microcystin-dependent protein
MGTPYLAELRLVSFAFAPKGWALANGQTLAINQNQALFALLGTTFGGNGQQTFLLPNLQGKVAVHVGTGQFSAMGQTGGEASHTLTASEIPVHNHQMFAVGAAHNATSPGNALVANTSGNLTVYGTASPAAMFGGNVGNTGGSQPHENRQPYLVMNWIIALQGIFPSRN